METVTKRRSVRLSQDHLLTLKTHREGFETSVACAASLGIDRNVLDRVLLIGSGSHDTIAKIKGALGLKDQDECAVVIGK